jgi:HSP20 family protein
MKIVRFSPVSPVDMFDTPNTSKHFSDVLDEFFNEALSLGYKGNGTVFNPKCNISEDENGYQVELAVPGIKKDDINISIKGNTLTVSGERKRRKEEDGFKYHRIESGYGEFNRELTLSDDIDRENIQANYVDGILTINLKKREQELNKQIEIK